MILWYTPNPLNDTRPAEFLTHARKVGWEYRAPTEELFLPLWYRPIYSRRRMGKISFAHSTYIHPSQARNRLASKGRKITSKSRPPLVGGSTRSLLTVSLVLIQGIWLRSRARTSRQIKPMLSLLPHLLTFPFDLKCSLDEYVFKLTVLLWTKNVIPMRWPWGGTW